MDVFQPKKLRADESHSILRLFTSFISFSSLLAAFFAMPNRNDYFSQCERRGIADEQKSSTHSPVGWIINHMLFYDRLIAFYTFIAFYVCIKILTFTVFIACPTNCLIVNRFQSKFHLLRGIFMVLWLLWALANSHF